MAGWDEIKQDANGKHSFNRVAGNHEVILRSQEHENKEYENKEYENKQGALQGIASVQANPPLDPRYARQTAKDDRPHFNLKAANQQIIRTIEMYPSAAARDKGIKSVKTNGPSSRINAV